MLLRHCDQRSNPTERTLERNAGPRQDRSPDANPRRVPRSSGVWFVLGGATFEMSNGQFLLDF